MKKEKKKHLESLGKTYFQLGGKMYYPVGLGLTITLTINSNFCLLPLIRKYLTGFPA
jgi:hypothetical protein